MLEEDPVEDKLQKSIDQDREDQKAAKIIGVIIVLCSLFVTFSFFIFSFLNNNNRLLTSFDLPEEHNGHWALQPSAHQSFEYEFTNMSNSLSRAYFPEKTPKDKRVAIIRNSIWSSTCRGEFEMTFAGVVQRKGFDQEVYSFYCDFDLDRFFYKEYTNIGNSNHTFSETYGDPKDPSADSREIKIDIDGQRMRAPMRHMIGSPRKEYIKERNYASFLPDGRAARKSNGQLVTPAAYKTEAYSVGQFFLKGIKIEELIHRMGVMNPPVQAPLSPEGLVQWKVPYPTWVLPLDPKKESSEMNMIYILRGEELRDNKQVLKIEFTGYQRLMKGKPKLGGEPVHNWYYHIKGDAWVELKSRMPLEVRLEENAQWYDIVTRNRIRLLDQPASQQKQIMERRYTNRYSIKRKAQKA